MAIIVLILSIFFEILAVAMALRLIPLTRSRIAWVLISTALVLRSARLTYQLWLTVYSSLDYPLVLLDESLGLTVSILTALGVYKIGPLFIAFRRAEEARDTYIHTISHDLRNPLTVIRGHTEIFMTDDMIVKSKGLLESAEAILEGADRIKGLLDDLLDAARWDGGQLKIRKEPVNLSQFLQHLIDTSFQEDEDRRIDFEKTTYETLILAEQDRLSRIIMNLMANALKYSPPKSPVVCRLKQSKNEVILSISNEGEGIRPEDLPHIFDRYYRAKRISGGRDGLGLGLFITRILVEAHDGKIWVENSPGRGCTFNVAFPLSSSLKGHDDETDDLISGS